MRGKPGYLTLGSQSSSRPKYAVLPGIPQLPSNKDLGSFPRSGAGMIPPRVFPGESFPILSGFTTPRSTHPARMMMV